MTDLRRWSAVRRTKVHRYDGFLCRCVIFGLLVFGPIQAIPAQDASGNNRSRTLTNPPAMFELALPPETELKTLIELVSHRLKVQFIYDEGVANKRISINSPKPIPVDSLLDVLRSALKMKGLALIEAEPAGWMRIVPAEDLAQIASAPNSQAAAAGGGAVAITQTFTLAHITPDRVAKVIEPFITKKGANIVVVADKSLLIVTDYAPNLRRIAQLIDLIDQAGPERVLKFLRIENIDASELSGQISQALTARGPGLSSNGPAVTVSADKRTNQLVIVGTRSQIDDVLQLVRAFDVPLTQRTHVYTFRHVDAERVDRLLKQTIDPLTAEHQYRSAVDRSDNFLVATGPERVHERILQLAKELDVETMKRGSSGLKFYRLKYADAQDVLNTLRAIEQRGSGPGDSAPRGASAARGGVGGPPGGPGGPDGSSVPPPSPGFSSAAGGPPNATQRDVSLTSQSGPAGSSAMPGFAPMPGGQMAPGGGSIIPGAARVSIDAKSNSLIVIADRPVQMVYEDLIRALDRPRPQVMIEAKIVILDTSDNYSLGVEVSAPVATKAAQILQFSSFGLSTVSAATGALALNPAQGFNWALVDPSAASAVIQAMANHTRSKVLSAPRLLVADNSTGNLASVQEVPYTSVNASTTVATTSFAGFAEAGTTIQVQPRIMDDNHLQLQFNVSLNSFTGSGSNGVPPPRQTDQISSKVTVPDGYTVIVGGLTNRNNSSSQNGIPWVECVPILKDLTSLQTKSFTQTTLFVFLRPVIMRDDKFRDLKYLSDRDIHCAQEPPNYPQSCPLLVR
jgi:general secretion pathway protein D